MYDELINSLRICGKMRSIDDYCVAFHDGCCEAEPVCMYELMKQAADAIEELIVERDAYCKAMTDEHNTAARLMWEHRWIPVTERLPEERYNYLVFAVGGAWKQISSIEIAYWDGDRFRVQSFNAVTHWMPLPEPPEDGES